MSTQNPAAQSAATSNFTIFDLKKLTGKPVGFEKPVASMCYFNNGKHTIQTVNGGIIEKVEQFGRSAEVKIKNDNYSYYVDVAEGQGVSMFVKK